MNLDIQLPVFEAEVFRGFPYPILMVGNTGMIQFASLSAAELLQLSLEELTARSWAGLDAQLTLIAWKKTWKELRQSGRMRYATDLAMGNDLLRPICVTLIPVNEQQAIVVLEDIQSDAARKAQLKLLSQQARAGHFRYDYLAKRWSVSPQFSALLGWEHDTDRETVLPEQEFRKAFSAALLPKSWSQLEVRLADALEAHTSFETELLLRSGLPNNRLMLTAVPLANDLHTVQVIGTLSSVSGASSGGTANDALARYSLDRAQDMILWSGSDGTVKYANRSVLDKLGYTRAEIGTMNIFDLVIDEREIVLEKLWGKLQNRKLAEGQAVIRTKKGSTLEVSYTANLIEENETQIVCFYIRDLTTSNQRSALLELTQFTLDNAPDLVFWTRRDGSIIYTNEAVSQKLGIAREELTTIKVQDIAPYLNEDVLREFWERLTRDRQITDEYPIFSRDGVRIDTEVSVKLLYYKGEEIACSFCRDITEVKKRRVRGELLESTLDSVRDIVLWLRPDGTIPYANKQFFKKTEYKPKELKKLQGPDFFAASSWQVLTNKWDVLRKGENWEGEVVMKLQNDKRKAYRANLDYVNYQGEEYISISLRDQSKKQQRDLQLKLSYGALEAVEEVVVWLRETGEVEYLNQAVINYIGKTKEHWQGQQLRRVFPQLNLEQVVPGTSLEYSMPSHEGHTVYLELTFSAIEREEDVYLVIMGRNFTERYLRRKEIDTAQRRIRELSARLQEENVVLRQEVGEGLGVENIITVSPNYQKVLQQISQVATADTTVLILGETGTGKELLARAVHELGDRAENPLIKVNCAALPEHLIESELFGHEQGAFTGAHARKRGRFELAHRGTIFLDEVGEMPLMLQAKLLRVLQEGEFERVGGTETIKVDVRLIAATNRSLEEMVRAGRFRADLYYRLNVFPIVNIPLRERPEDITVLAQFFARRFAQRQGKTIQQINAVDLKALQDYRFPGNVRELENIIERAVVLCKTETLRIQIDQTLTDDFAENAFITFDEMQREYIIKALKRTEGRITGPEGAGRLLGLNDRTLMSKMRKFGIQKKEYLV